MSLSTRATGAAFSPVAMVVALLVGVVALAGLGVLSAYAPELRSGDDGGGHALSRASTGFGALPPLLRGLGAPVMLSRGPLTGDADDRLLVLTPPVGAGPAKVEALAGQGSALVVLPKWGSIPDPDRPGWVRTLAPLPAEAALSPLPDDLRGDLTLNERSGRATIALRNRNGAPVGRPVVVENLRTLSGADWIPLVADEQGRTVLGVHRDEGLYVLADPDLLSTHGLKSLNGAATAVALLDELREPETPVVFDLTLHGLERTRNLLRLLLEPPLLGLTLALLGLAALAGWQAAVRFGPARESDRAIAPGKRGLADNTAALVRLARREHHMAVPYAILTRNAVARAIGAPRNLDDEALEAFLDRVGRTNGATTPYTALAEQARAVRTPGDLLRVALALHRWTQELTRARQ